MRPKKVILLVDSYDYRLSLRRFVLETTGRYRVLTATSAVEALNILDGLEPQPYAIDLLLTELLLEGHLDGNRLPERAKSSYPWLPVLMVGSTVEEYARALAADVFLPKGACSTAQILRSVRLLMMRKRGPRSVSTVQAWAAARAAQREVAA